MTDSSQIKFPSFGYSMELVYHFKDLVDANLSISFFNEFSDSDEAQTFYNYHLSIDLKDNILEYVTEAKIYYSQYFTNTPFDQNQYHENLLRGFRLGTRIYKNFSLVVDYHDVFYDTDLNGVVDLVRTGGIDLLVKF